MAAEILDGQVRSVLEPSAGDGVFLSALADVAETRGINDLAVTAVEKDQQVYRNNLTSFPDSIVGQGICADFLATQATPHDAVIGNPPYVRLRNLPAIERDRALRIALECLDHPMDPSGSVWMPFVLHSCQSLVQGGRMALVLPYELTYVRYAKPLWKYLAYNFGHLRVARVYERVFPEILQDVILLFAQDKGRYSSTVTYDVFDTVADLLKGSANTTTELTIHEILDHRPFVSSLLPARARSLLNKIEGITTSVADCASFSIGYVCGDKDFFHPSKELIDEFDIQPQNLYPAVRSTRQLIGNGLYTSALPDQAKTHLFSPSGTHLNWGEHRYIRQGEESGVDKRYKCRIRKPWFQVPYVRIPDLILSVFSDTPVLLDNDGHLTASNSLLCGIVHAQVRARDFISAWYTSLTLLSIELNVHSLGGGVLVFVPREAGRIRIVHPSHTDDIDLSLVDQQLRTKDLQSAYEIGDASLRKRGILQSKDLEAIIEARQILRRWRQRPI